MPSPLERLDAWARTNRWAGDLLLAGFLTCMLGFVSAAIVVKGGERSGLLALPSLALLHGALIARRTAPAVSFAAVTLALAAQVVLLPYPLPSDALFAVSLYSLSAYAPRPWPLVGLGVGMLGAVVAAARFTTTGVSVPGLTVLTLTGGFIGASVLAAWGLGSFRRIRTQYVAALEERAVRAEADRREQAGRAAGEERARIAREMHDVVAHSLSIVVVQAQGGVYAARTDPARAVPVLDTIAETARSALTDMRGLLGVVRAGADAGGEPNAGGEQHAGGEPNAGGGQHADAPQPGLGDLPSLVERTRATGLAVHWTQHGQPRPLSATAGLAVYRVVQESLTNTLKHGGPGAGAALHLDWQARGLLVAVSDNGVGGTLAPSTGGHGLVGMRERLAVFGGSVEIGSRPGGGFGVRAWLPYEHTVGRA